MKTAKKLVTYIMVLFFAGLLLGFAPNAAISKTPVQGTMIPMSFR